MNRAPLEGLVVAWAPVVAAGRARRCLSVNCAVDFVLIETALVVVL